VTHADGTDVRIDFDGHFPGERTCDVDHYVGRAYSGSVVEVFTLDGVVHMPLDGKIVKRHDATHMPEQEEAALRRKRPMAPAEQRTGRTLAAAQEVGP
jgi:hypothetical protein